MKRRIRRWLLRITAATAVVLGAFAAYVYLVPFPVELLDRDRVLPVRIFDRQGRPLRQGLSSDGTRGCWVPLSEISPWLVTATLVAEDRRFRSHPGVDPLAVLRATKDNTAAGRRVSGASTLTMQLVRLLRPRPRSWRSKVEEAVMALRLERVLTKEQILVEYLNRAPYGANFVGAEAAALRTFGKPARDLSPAEAALLAGLPQSPVRLDPLRHPGRARSRQRWILEEMHRLGHLDRETLGRALEECDPIVPRPVPCEASTFVDWVHEPGDRELRTTLDLDLQRDVEAIATRAAADLQAAGASECAVVVVENGTGEVRAFVGPAARRRSPGSALKPFIYALAMESGRTAASLYDDAPVQFQTPTGVYAPRNYDGTFHGPVTLRTALANSLNVPAVLALREVGLPRFVAFVRALGLDGIDPDPRVHGLGLAIGSARVSPIELAGAYAMLARGGEFIELEGRPGPSRTKRLISPETAYVIADILSDNDARALSFGTGTDLAFDFRVAAKTGTSADHRDNWVAGFTRDFTVVVWVGNADGRPLRGTSGVEGAGPLFREVMLRVAGSWLVKPTGLHVVEVCPDSGCRRGPSCERAAIELFRREQAPPDRCTPKRDLFRVESPQPGDRFVVDQETPDQTRFLRFRARAPEGCTIQWFLDGRFLAATTGEHEFLWPVSHGGFELRVLCEGAEVVRRFDVR